MTPTLDTKGVSEIAANAPSITRANEQDTFNTLFAVLEEPIRRYILHTLINDASTMRFEELADAIAECESINVENKSSIQTKIYHRHLPEIEKADMVEIDNENQLVEATIEDVHTDFIVDYIAQESGWT